MYFRTKIILLSRLKNNSEILNNKNETPEHSPNQ